MLEYHGARSWIGRSVQRLTQPWERDDEAAGLRGPLNIRRMQLDVDKAVARPDLLELAAAISSVSGVEAFNVTVTEIDIQTMGMEVTIEGQYIDVDQLERAIAKAGAAVHSIDEVVVGDRIVERVPRTR